MRHTTWRWIKFDFAQGTDRTVLLRGFTIEIDGAAEGIVVTDAGDREHMYAAPAILGSLTEYPDRDTAAAHTLMLLKSARFTFPEALPVQSFTLHHRSTNGKSYTIVDIFPLYAE